MARTQLHLFAAADGGIGATGHAGAGWSAGPLPALGARAERYLEQERSARTRANYARDFAGFARWCESHELAALPASPRTIALYLMHLAVSGRKMSTIRRARIAVGVTHGDAGLGRPDQDRRVRKLERGMGREHGTREEGAPPLLLEHIVRMVAKLGTNVRDDRDRALVLVGFWGALRASELVALQRSDVVLHDTGWCSPFNAARPTRWPTESTW
jgi:integrase